MTDENTSRKLVWNMSKHSPKGMNIYEDLESLSIEEDIALNYAKMNKNDSDELFMMEKMGVDEEMDKLDNCDMIDA
jgi:hypothetical protein